MTRAANRLGRRRGLSLLETIIAVAIFGVGMVMVAAMFPVALTEHRRSADTSRALEMVSKAEAMLHNRLDAQRLWVDSGLLRDGIDSPWNLLPFANFDVPLPAPGSVLVPGSGDLVDRSDYTDAINFWSPFPPVGFTKVQLFGADVLSDRIIPLTDAQTQDAPNRLVWYGFYRQLADGSKSFAVAVCKQRRKQSFYLQDLSVADPTGNPTILLSPRERFPVPWRVTVARLPGTNDLFSVSTAATLDQLAPRGSKLMIQGGTSVAPGLLPTFPAGRILTVAQSLATNQIRVLEDISDIPDASANNFNFDVWIFPPAALGDRFGPDSPVLEWKVSL